MIPPSIHSNRGAAWLRPALLGALLAFTPALRAQIKVGDSFPSLQSAELDGARPDTAGKVLLVDFWASWCTPCKASFPAYARIYGDFSPRGLALVAVSVDKVPADYAAFLRKMAPPFATARDVGQRLVTMVRVPSMPTSYLMGRDGRVRFIHEGFHSAGTEAEIRKEIEALLNEKSAP
jgi:thiol-disulfide isomerase/thioredoxin